jgi:hypothetical protein
LSDQYSARLYRRGARHRLRGTHSVDISFGGG